jgi:thiamine-phosphate pyrophosphorylase
VSADVSIREQWIFWRTLPAVSSHNREAGLVTGGSAAEAQSSSAPAGVYALTPGWNDTARLLERTERALRGGVRWLQYRNKGAAAELRREQAQALRALTWKHGAALVVNDDAELAVAVRADGVHCGRDDPLPDDASCRYLIVGVSCYDQINLARLAWRGKAQYVAFGAVFASPTKPAAVRAPLELLRQARGEGMHVVAIGGIDAGNIRTVAAHGAHAAALITAIYEAQDPEAAARELVRLFELGRLDHESQ